MFAEILNQIKIKKHKNCSKKNLKNLLHNFTGSNSITITKIYFQSHTYTQSKRK